MTSSRNLTLKFIREEGGHVLKVFDDHARFLSEVTYSNLFRASGFAVPKQVSIESITRTIAIDYLADDVERKKAAETQQCIVQEIASIAHFMNPLILPSPVLRTYTETLQKRLWKFKTVQATVMDRDRVSHWCARIEELKAVTLFKDCKEDNFLYHQDSIVLIDFDYVKPTFILADFAQYYVSLTMRNAANFEQFLDLTLTHLPSVKLSSHDAPPLFALAVVNTCLARLAHNPNLNFSERARLVSFIHTHLRYVR